MSAGGWTFRAVDPLGAPVRGELEALAAPLGAPMTVALGGAVCIIGGIVFGVRLPSLRGPARELIVAQQLSAGTPP